VLTADPGATLFLFAPEDDVQAAFLAVASAEQDELCCSAYAYTLQPLVDAMIANHKRGLSQFVLADLSQSRGPADHRALVEVIDAGIDVVIGTAPSGNILHSKYLLGKSQSAVFTGSYNFSASAAVQDNCSQVFTSAPVWTAFRAHFDTARSWVAANEPQDQIRAAVANGTVDALRLPVPLLTEQ
jgi:phosphatidylserine/phosphatidylglycerophosphate/cardiolipin synthase-like enzyme